MAATCIVDSSSAILLYKAGLFEDLLNNYTVICPPEVIDELTRNPSFPGAQYFLEAVKKEIIQLSSCRDTNGKLDFTSLPLMGKGETMCIALYCHEKGDFILLDDKKAAIFCKKKSIPYINALLLPKILFVAGLIDETLQKSSQKILLKEGRYGEKIKLYAENMNHEDLKRFFPDIE